jgi:hypothetical protein
MDDRSVELPSALVDRYDMPDASNGVGASGMWTFPPRLEPAVQPRRCWWDPA